uniref:Uncharacterized protein n=1 Tax=Ditylenchus dipsaci TaxID=166011 RepID=A0A915ECM1_9BILA
MFSTPTILLLCLLNASVLLAQPSGLSSSGGQFGSSSEFGSLSQYPSSSSLSGFNTGSIYSPYSSSSQYRGSSFGPSIQGQGISPYASSSQYPYSQQSSLYGAGLSTFLYGNGGSIYGNGLSPYGSSPLASSTFGSSPYSQGSSLSTGVSTYPSTSPNTPAYCCVSMTNPVPSTPLVSSASVSPSIPSPSSLYNSGALSPYGSYPPVVPSPYNGGIGSSPYTSVQPYTPVASIICYPLCPNAYGAHGNGGQSTYPSGLRRSTYPYTSTGFGTGGPNYPYSAGFGSQYLSGATNISPYSNFNGAGFGGLTSNGFGEEFGKNKFGSSHRRATSTHSTTSPNSQQSNSKSGNKSGASEDSLAHVPYAKAVKKQ